MEITQAEHSILRLCKLYFNQFAFENSGTREDNLTKNTLPKMTVSVSISANDSTTFTITLSMQVRTEGVYQLSCELTGIFEVEGGLTDDNIFLQDNAVAIMFPYMRSQVTLLTSQPGLEPVIIPTLNIKKVLHPDD